MALGFGALVLAYVLSQFFRAFLAVMAPLLEAELGATPADLSLASGLWFATFAAMQLPVGAALDRIGPRRTAAVLLVVGGAGGAALFAVAQSPGAIVVAMALIGVGCSPVLMASLYIFARLYRPAVFASLAGAMIGAGSAGNVAGAAPMAWAAEAFGWRPTVLAIAAVTLAVGAALLAFVRDPPAPEAPARRGTLVDLLRLPAFWVMIPLLVTNYAPAAGIRGLWAGPYLGDVFGLDTAAIGAVTLWMALAMIAGNFAYGPMDRLLGTRKWVNLGGNALCLAVLLALALAPPATVVGAGIMLAAVGFFGSSFAMMIAHARSLFPPHLIGRGVSFANLLAVGGVGAMQIASGRLHVAVLGATGSPEAAYSAIFGLFAVALLAGLAVYLFARDRLD